MLTVLGELPGQNAYQLGAGAPNDKTENEMLKNAQLVHEVNFCAVASACDVVAGKNGYRFEFWATTPNLQHSTSI